MHEVVVNEQLAEILISKIEFESGPPPYMTIVFTDGRHLTVSYDPNSKDLLIQTGHMGLLEIRIPIPEIPSYQQLQSSKKMQNCPYSKQVIRSVHTEGHGHAPQNVDICSHPSQDSKEINPDICMECSLFR